MKLCEENKNEQETEVGVDSFGRLVRCEHLNGMGLKGHDDRGKPGFPGPPRNRLENCLMSKVKTVEISDAQNAGPACESVRRFGQ